MEPEEIKKEINVEVGSEDKPLKKSKFKKVWNKIIKFLAILLFLAVIIFTIIQVIHINRVNNMEQFLGEYVNFIVEGDDRSAYRMFAPKLRKDLSHDEFEELLALDIIFKGMGDAVEIIDLDVEKTDDGLVYKVVAHVYYDDGDFSKLTANVVKIDEEFKIEYFNFGVNEERVLRYKVNSAIKSGL